MWFLWVEYVHNLIKTFPLFVVCRTYGDTFQYYRGHKWPKWTNELAKAIYYPLEKSAKGVVTFMGSDGYGGELFISHFFVEGELYAPTQSG
jgi:hypothetical protein